MKRNVLTFGFLVAMAAGLGYLAGAMIDDVYAQPAVSKFQTLGVLLVDKNNEQYRQAKQEGGYVKVRDSQSGVTCYVQAFTGALSCVK